jgi:hypothetical protein
MQTGKHTIALKKLSFDHLGNPGSFVGNPDSARVCPCLATDLHKLLGVLLSPSNTSDLRDFDYGIQMLYRVA